MNLRQRLAGFAERESHRPDHGRAWRCMIAFMAPLLLALTGHLGLEVTFAAIAAQNIAMVDVRGAYAMRLTLLVAMAAILAGAAGFGGLMGHPLAAALLATVIVAACTGLWRHLSSDYGPSLAISSSLLFFIALAVPGGAAAAGHHAIAALIGGLWGAVLQVALWPINAQHPLRRAVSDAWLAAGALFAALNTADEPGGPPRSGRIAAGESGLRTELDRAYAVLGSASPRSPVVTRLEDLNLAGARLAMRVMALNTTLETLSADPAFAGLEVGFQPLLTALSNTARTVALAVVSRQPAHFATAEVRLRRLDSLLRALQAKVAAQAGESPSETQLVQVLKQLEDYLPVVGDTLRATVDRAGERTAFSLELFDMQNLRLRPLAAALNLSRHVDRALLRFTLRIAVLTVIAVALLKFHPLPHAYWLPFTLVVVLQPDYGSTRKRAAQRLLGTLAGSILASLTLWLHLPFAAIMALTAAMTFCFGFMAKRNYGVAVIFVTLFVVLLTEANGPVTIGLTLERLATTTAGGLLALLAAAVFWPVWERDLFPRILARALRANRDYLTLLIDRLRRGGPYDRDVTAAKRSAEAAAGAVFSSIGRMAGDPRNRQDRIEMAAALANGNQRLMRIANLLALHLDPTAPLPSPGLAEFSKRASASLGAIAAAIEEKNPDPSLLAGEGAALDALRLPRPADGSPRLSWVVSQLQRAGTELGAMLLAARDIAP